MYLASKQGQVSRAQQLAAAAMRLTAALFRESNPVPVKYALSVMKLMSARVRLPLVELGDESKAQVDAALAEMRERAKRFEFEQAASLRDTVRDLKTKEFMFR